MVPKTSHSKTVCVSFIAETDVEYLGEWECFAYYEYDIHEKLKIRHMFFLVGILEELVQ